jgi:hypothetical protein
MIDHRIRSALRSDIEAHLLMEDGAGWKTVQQRYPQVSAATFWRVVRDVKAARENRAKCSEVVAPSRSSLDHAEAAGGPAEPGFPPLSEDLTPTRLIAEYDGLLDDAERLRAYSIDAQGNVLRPATFLQSAKLRERVVSSAALFVGELWGANTTKALFEMTVEALKAADKTVAKQVLQSMESYFQRLANPKASSEEAWADETRAIFKGRS